MSAIVDTHFRLLVMNVTALFGERGEYSLVLVTFAWSSARHSPITTHFVGH
jgi:hypothetical protein